MRSIIEKETVEDTKGIIAWRDVDPGYRDPVDYGDARTGAWNYEQTVRRALKGLERRGLVTLGRYAFHQYDHQWLVEEPKDYIPGEGRIMTGVMITEAGRVAAGQQSRREKKMRAEWAAEPPLDDLAAKIKAAAEKAKR